MFVFYQVSSLAPTDEEVKSKMTASKAEHEKKVELLTEQTNHEKNPQEDFHSQRQTECERYLSTLRQEMKTKVEAKMSQLAEEFLNDNG